MATENSILPLSPLAPPVAPPSSPTTSADPILVYDGECGFCSATVQFVFRHERRRHNLRFGTLQGPTATTLRATHPALANVDSVIWYIPRTAQRPEKILVRSSAGLAVLTYLGGPWRLLAPARLIPRFLRDAVYNFIARHRRQIAPAACILQTPQQRARFIE